CTCGRCWSRSVACSTSRHSRPRAFWPWDASRRLDRAVALYPARELLDVKEPGMSEPVTLPTLLGDYPVTHALREGEVTSPSVRLSFAEVPSVASAFKRVVRALEFDVAELAIMTFLIAKAHGVPLVLLPAVVLGRFQHR